MKIRFGIYLDGADWAAEKIAIGNITAGPLEMLKILEDRLGLSGIATSQPERISAYQQKINAADCRWCRESFAIDPWATARQMLQWRDELVDADWDKTSGTTKRLKTLAEIEKQSCAVVDPAVSDRMQNVLAALKSMPLKLNMILNEPLELYTPLWRKIIAELQKSNPGIACQTIVAGGDIHSKLANGKLRVITDFEEFSLAEFIARFLAEQTKNNNADETVILSQSSTFLLDRMLHRHGMPALGVSEDSPFREALCALPMMIENLWESCSVMHLTEFLNASYCPIDRDIADEIIRALQKNAGIGNEDWEKVFIPHPDANECKKKELLKTKRILETHYAPHAAADDSKIAGIPVADLDERCDWLSDGIKSNMKPEFAITLNHIELFRSIIKDYKVLTRIEIYRILDSIISTGTGSENIRHEAAPYKLIRSPGALTGKCTTLIWWNFTDRGMKQSSSWTPEEIASAKLEIETDLQIKQEQYGWQDAIQKADSVILCIPKFICGEPVFHHPFMDQIKTSAEALEIPEYCYIKRPSDSYDLLKNSVELETVNVKDGIQSRNAFKLPENKISHEHISFTELEKLIECPFCWFMKHHSKLEKSTLSKIPTGALLKGTFAHKLIELIFNEKKTWTPETAEKRAGELYDDLCSKMAIELKGGFMGASRGGRTKKHILHAIRKLVEEINHRRLNVESVEKKYPAEGAEEIKYCDTSFKGAADMVMHDQNGDIHIFDLKWSSSSKYQDHIEKGTALQLASYAWLETGDACKAHCAYYLLPKYMAVEDENKDSWADLWKSAANTYSERMREIRGGHLSLLDVESDGALTFDSQCDYCDFRSLCNSAGVKEEYNKGKKKKNGAKTKSTKAGHTHG